MKCKICQNRTVPLFSTKVLNKYDVKYFQCSYCDFIQTEKPFWLDEAYQHAITNLDIGLVSRNQEYSKTIYNIITSNLNYHKSFLDYAGGFGLFVRMMRDLGLDFYHYDKYCKNIFAKNHDLANYNSTKTFEAVTAIEVFEHLNHPLNEIKKLMSFTNTIIFSTTLIPKQNITSSADWWYFIPETGQHISFYSIKTFKYIAKLLNLRFYSQDNLHILTKSKTISNPFKNISSHINIPSLIESDYKLAKHISFSKIPSSLSSKNKENNSETINEICILFDQTKKLETKNQLLKKKLLLAKKVNIQNRLQLQKATENLNSIYNSTAWFFVKRYYSLKDKFLLKATNLQKFLNKFISKS